MIVPIAYLTANPAKDFDLSIEFVGIFLHHVNCRTFLDFTSVFVFFSRLLFDIQRANNVINAKFFLEGES
jgi:hypothetical protein